MYGEQNTCIQGDVDDVKNEQGEEQQRRNRQARGELEQRRPRRKRTRTEVERGDAAWEQHQQLRDIEQLQQLEDQEMQDLEQQLSEDLEVPDHNQQLVEGLQMSTQQPSIELETQQAHEMEDQDKPSEDMKVQDQDKDQQPLEDLEMQQDREMQDQDMSSEDQDQPSEDQDQPSEDQDQQQTENLGMRGEGEPIELSEDLEVEEPQKSVGQQLKQVQGMSGELGMEAPQTERDEETDSEGEEYRPQQRV